MKRLLSGIPVLALILCVTAASASPAPAIAAFDDAFAKVNDYTVTVKAHEVKGDRVQDRTYHYFFKRPNWAKTDIVAGDGAGSGGVWKGGNVVKGHLRVAFITVGKTVDIHDGRATSLRGYTIPDGLLQNEVDKYRETKGELTERDGGDVDGTPTDEIELKIADPAANDNITRAVLYLSKTTHFPVKQVRYEGDKEVADETFSDLKTNVGLKDSDFPF
jgi:outer membrane lipoprotein-sorting protein